MGGVTACETGAVEVIVTWIMISTPDRNWGLSGCEAVLIYRDQFPGIRLWEMRTGDLGVVVGK